MLYNTWDKYAYDLIANLAVPIDNYISRGTDVFVTGTASDGSRWLVLKQQIALHSSWVA